MFKTLVIPASQSRVVNVTGTSFYIEAATGVVDIQFEEGAILRVKPGQTIDLPPGDLFKQITFTNPDTTNSITVQYYAGTIAVGTRTPYVFTKPAPTYIVGASGTVTNAADVTLLNTNLRTGKTVADTLAFLVLTNTATNYIIAKDPSGNDAYACSTGIPVQIITTGIVKIRAVAASNTYVVAYHFNYDS